MDCDTAGHRKERYEGTANVKKSTQVKEWKKEVIKKNRQGQAGPGRYCHRDRAVLPPGFVNDVLVCCTYVVGKR